MRKEKGIVEENSFWSDADITVNKYVDVGV
jgi:hypothetical protein